MKYYLPFVALIGFGLSVTAQVRRQPARQTQQQAPPPKTDTVPAVQQPAQPPLAEIPTEVIRKSLRNDNAIEKNLVKDRIPLAYEHIREDDAMYRQKVWREIDTREKINLAFRYSAEEDNGSQRFISILLNSIKTGELTAFNPIDDRFTTPFSLAEVAEQVSGKSDTLEVIDPTDVTGLRMVKKIIRQDFNPDDVRKFRLKEEWVFDKESSRMFVRILGIAPIKTIFNEDGSERGETPMFWVYYPDMRVVLAKFEAYNGKNYGARMSWEELLESRYFSSYIVKSTLDNPFDRTLKAYIKDPILRLLEGDAIKEKIFNYEQNLWSY